MILVTGATGFLGRNLVVRLSKTWSVRALGRGLWAEAVPPNVETLVCGDLSLCLDWSEELSGVDVVVHCAARVHVKNDLAKDPLEEFRLVNVKGTASLARQAAIAGVKRFIFISSIGVNGDETTCKPYAASDTPSPHTAYAVSKLEAELELMKIAMETGMEVVIIRPPLIYGPDAPGNFSTLMDLLLRGVPLPIGMLDKNRRSFVCVENLTSLISTCIVHPAAANEVFLVSDGESLSTVDLVRRLGRTIGRRTLLVPVPEFLLRLCGRLFGKSDAVQRICGSLEVDITKTKLLLNWIPSVTPDEGFRQIAVHRSQKKD